MKKVSANWNGFGVLLGLDCNELDELRLDYPGQTAACWNKVMDHWRKGNSAYPPTWDGLYSLLDDMEYSEYAIELKKAVSRAIEPSCTV